MELEGESFTRGLRAMSANMKAAGEGISKVFDAKMAEANAEKMRLAAEEAKEGIGSMWKWASKGIQDGIDGMGGVPFSPEDDKEKAYQRMVAERVSFAEAEPIITSLTSPVDDTVTSVSLVEGVGATTMRDEEDVIFIERDLKAEREAVSEGDIGEL